jgi:hypothetical protein
MFSPTIVKSEEFLSMPSSSQLLYFHLGMDADDDGFIQPKMVMKIIGSADDDLRMLIGRRFILPFDSGVVVIKHWLIHNLIQKDRYHPTRFQEEKNKLFIKQDKGYTENPDSVNKMLTQVRLGKDSKKSDSEAESESFSVRPTFVSRETEAVDDVVVETNIDEDGNVRTHDSFGNPLKKGPKIVKEGKNKIAVRIQQKFVHMCKKEIGTLPIANMAGYTMVLRALNTGGLTETQIYDLFEEWFSLGKPDEEAVQITRALSDVQVNAYKVRNEI